MNDEHDVETGEAHEVERRARELFAASVGQLDAATLSRLNRSRQRALNVVRGQQPRARLAWSRWMPAGAVAAAVLGAVLLWNARLEPAQQVAQTAAITATSQQEPLELIAANADDLQLAAAEDDLDFFAWVSDADATTDGDDAAPGEGQT
jgi:hypothetical protein